MGILKFLGVNDCGDPIFDEPLGEELVSDLGVNLDAFPIPPEPTILDRSATLVSQFLDDARSEKVRLEAEIRRLSELLRQTNVAIEAFEPTLLKLDDGYDAADDGRKSYDAAIEAKRSRKAAKAELIAAE